MENVPAQVDVPKLNGAINLGKRKTHDTARVEIGGFKAKTEHDLKWGLQKQLQFEKDSLLPCIPASLPSFNSRGSS